MVQAAQPGRPLRVAAANVNGLSAGQKRRQFFAWLQKQRADIALLSETHCTSDSQARQWVQEGAGLGRPWRGESFWCHQQQQGERAAGGVCVLLSHRVVSAAATPVVEHQGPSGRVLKVSWQTPWGCTLAATAVYAPCNPQERPGFFLGEYLEAVTSGTQQYQIVGGDLNCIMRPEDELLAAQQQPGASSRRVGGGDLQAVNFLAGLTDAWLLQHPHQRQPTHYTRRLGSNSSSSGGSAEQQGLDDISGGRIDYVFLSEDMVAEGWLQRSQQHRLYPSDHRPVVVYQQPPGTPEPGPRRWRFPNHLLGVEAFREQLRTKIQEARAAQEQRSPRLDLAAEWEQLKEQVQALCQQLEQQLKAEQQRERRRLWGQVVAARRAHRQLGDARSVQQLLDAEQALTVHETTQLEQQTAVTEPLWEVYGEQPTFWFHQLGREAREPQAIAEVTRPDGVVVAAQGREGTAAVGELLADYYDPAKGGLFSCHPTDRRQQEVMLAAIDRRLDEQQQQQCSGEGEDGTLTLREAQAALASLPRGKAPGSDGLTYEFYTAYWEQVGQPLVAAFNYSFQQPQLRLSEQQRLGLITLIYKGGDKPRADPASYRPITLLNCDLKIVAKVLVHRLGPACASVIDPTQTAFVPGRDIADNVLHHLEEIDFLQEEQQPGCIVFLDFEKAYDRLNRGWLLRCMEAMHFPESSRRWVRLLLAGTQGCITFNSGHRSRVFDIPSGCAQGSPLSPLLYVIAAQPLAARCRQLQREGRITSIGLPSGQGPAPCCHQHADDTTLHAATATDVGVLLQQAVVPFCAASAAKLNVGKSKGMGLGPHRSMVGLDAATGIVFVDTAAEPIRHLGVLLSIRGATAFADQLFEQRLRSIGHRARAWSRYNLTLLGRCEVARQVLASCLVYHAQFVPIPERLMRPIQRRISAFVLGLGCIRASDNRQLRWRPAPQVASLQAKQGGIAFVDVQAHITAMQAKVLAALLHPHRHAWKLFMRANLERASQGVGVRLLLQQQSSAQAASAQRRRLNPRHAAHVAAFRALGLHRRTPHGSMTAQQIHLETVVGNHSVADAVTGGLFSTERSLPSQLQHRTAGTTLGQVAADLSFQPAVDGMVLPADWQQTLQQPAQPPQWEVDTQGRWVYQHSEEGGVWWEVQHDGSLACLDSAPALPPDPAFAPCCVVFAPVGGPRRQRKQRQQAGGSHGEEDVPKAFYLVGQWGEVLVDPSVWGFGPDLGLLQYAVREATRRLVQLKCRSQRGWVPGLGVRPRLWRDSEGNLAAATGLQQLEARQKRTFAELLQGGFSTGSSSSRITTADQLAAYDAPWMHDSPERQHVMQRVAERAATAGESQQTAWRQQQALQHVEAPAVDDTTDPLDRGLPPALEADAPWVAAYRRAADKRLPRSLRVFGWQLLHAAVMVGGSRVHAAANRQELLQCCCRQPQCQPAQPSPEQHQQQPQGEGPQQQQQQHLHGSPPQQQSGAQQPQPHQQPGASQQQQQPPGAQQQQQQPQQGAPQQQRQQQGAQQQQQQPGGMLPGPLSPEAFQLESLSHLFVQCPVAVGVWGWFARVWHRVQPDAAPELSSVRVLLLDDSTVWQPPQALRPLWTYLRLLLLESLWVVRCASDGRPFSSASVITRFRAALQQQLTQDWLRTQGDIRLNSGVPLSWLRGRNPVLQPGRFEAKWQRPGVLYRMEEGLGPRLVLPGVGT
jgi:exonuclease III